MVQFLLKLQIVQLFLSSRSRNFQFLVPSNKSHLETMMEDRCVELVVVIQLSLDIYHKKTFTLSLPRCPFTSLGKYSQ